MTNMSVPKLNWSQLSRRRRKRSFKWLTKNIYWSRIFDVTPKRTRRLYINFLRQTRNFLPPALHFLSFARNWHLSKRFHTPALVKWDNLRNKNKKHEFWEILGFILTSQVSLVLAQQKQSVSRADWVWKLSNGNFEKCLIFKIGVVEFSYPIIQENWLLLLCQH